MICQNCNHDNPAQAKFCLECGTPFATRCPGCDTELPTDAKFCLECGAAVAAAKHSVEAKAERDLRDYTPKHLVEKILQSRSALEGESKQVTVMFADVKGSMDLAQQLGPEGWHDVLDQFFGILGDGVHRYEGTINQYTGDGIMALFGAPIAHEDHAQRACYAGIKLRGQLKDFADRLRIERGVDFGVRIGINSGEVIVGKIDDDLRMDYTAQGHTVGLAQRIEQLAATGRVYISEFTEHLVAGYFSLNDLGATSLAGAENPIGIYELENASNARTRLEVARTRGFTRFVGRVDEMQTIESAFQRAREGRGQVVGVVGDPGLGKSRLCFEFVERRRAEGVQIVDGHCPAHGKNIPLIPVLELWRSYFGITTQDLAEQARQKIAGALVLLDPSFQEALPMFFDFLGVADPNRPHPKLEADVRQQQLLLSLRQLYRTLAETGEALVIYIDDVHWIDPASDAFLEQMVEAVAENSRILLLLNFRPEYSAQWMRRAYYQQLPLVPLGAEALKELVESLLGRDARLIDLADRIMHWTGGNPFYIEEIVNELVETGHLDGVLGTYKLLTDVEKLEIPVNVRSVLAARIDRLSETAKQLLQAASVIGKEFPAIVLEGVDKLSAGDRAEAIERLKFGDFLFETALYPEIEYAFKHPLTHEVAYASLLQTKRSELHAAAALSIEKRAGEKLDEQSALLAYHWDTANNAARAIEWHHRAAEWCALTDATGGLYHWERVSELASELPEDKEILTLGALACSRIMGFFWRLGGELEDIERVLVRGKGLAERAADQSILAQLVGAHGAYLGVNLGHANDYRKYSLEALHDAELVEGEELKYALKCAYLSAANALTGRWSEVLEIIDTTPGIFTQSDLYGSAIISGSPRVLALCNAALAEFMFGRPAAARDLRAHINTETVIERCQEIGMIGRFRGDCLPEAIYGNPDSAMATAQNIYSHLETIQTGFASVIANLAMGIASSAQGHAAEAVPYLENCISTFEQDRAGGMFIGAARGHLAEAQIELGKIAEGLKAADEAVDFCTEYGQKCDLQPWLALVRARILSGDELGAKAAIDQAQQVILETGAVVYQPLLHERRADFAEVFACDWTANDELSEALRLYEDLGADGHAQRVHVRLQ
ncbi:MAG: class 3 adenylate cyclase [Gammaproteobacteria bacterium]|jgi:class 3 adenylate cyclase